VITVVSLFVVPCCNAYVELGSGFPFSRRLLEQQKARKQTAPLPVYDARERTNVNELPLTMQCWVAFTTVASHLSTSAIILSAGLVCYGFLLWLDL